MIPTIFILDDEAPARQRLRALLSDIALQCPTNVIGEAEQVQEALDSAALYRADIVLLDVQMPGMSGIEFARHLLQNVQNHPAVIFVSAHDAYALQAFEVQAFDYLLKPVRAQRLQEAILRAVRLRHAEARADGAALAALPAQAPRQFFSVLERSRILLVPVQDVLYIKAEQKYLTLHTRTGQHLIEESLQAIELEMPALLLRIHRNTLIARAELLGVERGMELDEQTGRMTDTWQVILRNCQDRLPISRRLWPSIKALVK